MVLSEMACEVPHGMIYKVEGEMDLYSFLPFVNGVLGSLDKGHTRILVDMSEMHYLDSSGVGGIIRLLQAAKAKGARLGFVGINGTPHKVLTMCHVITLIENYPDTASAAAFFRN